MSTEEANDPEEALDPEEELRERIVDALREVIDPEIGLDIITLGMVYEVEVRGDEADITFTLTTPGCPMEHAIKGGILQAVHRVPGIEQVNPILVWEPRWHPGLVEEGVL